MSDWDILQILEDEMSCQRKAVILQRRFVEAAIAEIKRLRDENFKIGEQFDLLHTLASAGQDQRDKALAEVERLKRESEEAIGHRDDYETICIEQGIKIRALQAEVERLREHNASCARWMAEMEAGNKRLRGEVYDERPVTAEEEAWARSVVAEEPHGNTS